MNAAAGAKGVRKPPLKTPPVVTSTARNRAKGGESTEAPSNINNNRNNTTINSSGNSSGPRAPGLKKKLFPAVVGKPNAAPFRIKGSGAAPGMDRRQPLVAAAPAPEATKPPPRAVQETSPEETESEILDNCYTRYLELRLMGQLELKKQRKIREDCTESLHSRVAHYCLDKYGSRAQIRLLEGIHQEVEQLERVESLNSITDPLVEKMLCSQMSLKCEELEESLAHVMDLLPVQDLVATPGQDFGHKLNLLSGAISTAMSDPQTPLGFVQGFMDDQGELQELLNIAKTDDHEINDQLVKVVSMKISHCMTEE